MTAFVCRSCGAMQSLDEAVGTFAARGHRCLDCVGTGGLLAGRARRDRGQAQVLAAEPDEWKAAAEAWLDTAIADGRRFSALDLVADVGQPERANAIGAIFGTASRRGDITRVGLLQGTRASQHGRQLHVWQAA